MPRNYDTTNHKPYPRVTSLSISYAQDGTPHIEYVEQMAILDGDNRVQHIDGTARRHVLDLSQITEPVQVVHPATGQPIPGQTVTQQQLMLGLLAFLRAGQNLIDAEADRAAGTAA